MSDEAIKASVQGWRSLAGLHTVIETRIERALQAELRLSATEYTVLDVLSEQDAWHMRMQQLSQAVTLSHSATTRLVTRLEGQGLLSRYLCDTDRRGIYTEVTDAGRELLAKARPVHDAALQAALSEAAASPELSRLVKAVESMGPCGPDEAKGTGRPRRAERAG
ncbi:MarR family transcriptional regulator [Streptomyces sp. NPDC051776]|uniref:MarR family winged helix-turn-helix transcriptional regulator n=1 Tax=Streptomyces sp. NPDC051776 TaxID=3155414 RepID=UPI0034300C08